MAQSERGTGTMLAVSDIQVLMVAGKLTPLGDPATNAPKWFAAVEMIRFASDQDWLHKATKEITRHWRNKRPRHQTPDIPSTSAKQMHNFTAG